MRSLDGDCHMEALVLTLNIQSSNLSLRPHIFNGLDGKQRLCKAHTKAFFFYMVHFPAGDLFSSSPDQRRTSGRGGCSLWKDAAFNVQAEVKAAVILHRKTLLALLAHGETNAPLGLLSHPDCPRVRPQMRPRAPCCR